MIIDFHTHIFPDDLAPKVLSKLLANINNLYTPVTDMNVFGLLANMTAWNIDISVIQ